MLRKWMLMGLVVGAMTVFGGLRGGLHDQSQQGCGASVAGR